VPGRLEVIDDQFERRCRQNSHRAGLDAVDPRRFVAVASEEDVDGRRVHVAGQVQHSPAGRVEQTDDAPGRPGTVRGRGDHPTSVPAGRRAPVQTDVRGGRPLALEPARSRTYRAGVDAGVAAALAASRLARLPEPALQRLLTRARLVRVPAGSVMYREGETGELLDLVVGGLVRVFVTAPDAAA